MPQVLVTQSPQGTGLSGLILPGYAQLFPQPTKKLLTGNPELNHNASNAEVSVMPIILCIDDRENALTIRKLLLESKGYTVLTASDGPTGIKLAREHTLDAVVLDYRMPGMNGVQVAEVLKFEQPTLPIVLLSGVPNLPQPIISVVDAYVRKGEAVDDLLSAIEQAMNSTSRKQPAKQGDSDHRMTA